MARTRYPGRYRDTYGEEQVVFENDFEKLRVVVRGVTFVGHSFEELKPLLTVVSASPDGDALSDCALECDIPLPVVSGKDVEEGQLRVRIELQPPRDAYTAAEPGFTLRLCLTCAGQTCCSETAPATFETALTEIQQALPDGVYFRSCFSCAFSDYSPYGHLVLGRLACFRDNESSYLQVHDKDGLFEIWDTMTEPVQDIYLCGEYERRKPGTGYRG
jgi:uncharacterized protein DUF6304